MKIYVVWGYSDSTEDKEVFSARFSKADAEGVKFEMEQDECFKDYEFWIEEWDVI